MKQVNEIKQTLKEINFNVTLKNAKPGYTTVVQHKHSVITYSGSHHKQPVVYYFALGAAVATAANTTAVL